MDAISVDDKLEIYIEILHSLKNPHGPAGNYLYWCESDNGFMCGGVCVLLEYIARRRWPDQSEFASIDRIQMIKKFFPEFWAFKPNDVNARDKWFDHETRVATIETIISDLNTKL